LEIKFEAVLKSVCSDHFRHATPTYAWCGLLWQLLCPSIRLCIVCRCCVVRAKYIIKLVLSLGSLVPRPDAVIIIIINDNL